MKPTMQMILETEIVITEDGYARLDCPARGWRRQEDLHHDGEAVWEWIHEPASGHRAIGSSGEVQSSDPITRSADFKHWPSVLAGLLALLLLAVARIC